MLVVAAPPEGRAQDIFKCSGGDSDGSNCSRDSNCAGGACAEARFVCLNGARDGERCDCPGSTCAGSTCAGGVRMGEACDCGGGGVCEPTVQFCSIESPGDRAGAPCLSNAQCGEFLCSSTGRYCWGGSQFKLACLQDEDCEADGSFGTCSEPGTPVAITSLCSRGSNNGAPCDENSQCPVGACVLGQPLCDGGPTLNGFCESDTDCDPESPCTLTGRICDGGVPGQYCIDASTCDGGNCVATGKYCDGDVNFTCLNDNDCIDNGNCVSAGIGAPEPTATAIPPAGNDDDGCAVNPNASTSGSSALLVVALILGALRRRRL